MNQPILSHIRRLHWASLVCLPLLLLLGCSLQKAKTSFEKGRFDEAVQAYKEVLDQDPSNIQARIGYRRAANRASEVHLQKAREAEQKGLLEEVESEVRQAYRLDPSNALAREWVTRLEAQRVSRQAADTDGGSLEDQRSKGEVKSPILLNPRSMEGIDLNIARKTSLREILSAISKSSGVSILFHSSYQDTSVSADLRGLTFQRILDTLMLQSDLFYKVLDSNTVMVFRNTPQNREQFENQFIKTFYLSNANVDDVRSIFQTLMPQLKVFVDKRLNAVTIKAKSTDLAIAKRIVSQLDKAKAEVMIYIELLEVTENSMEQVGLLPVLSATDGLGGGSGIFRIGATVDNTGAPNVSKGGIHITKSDLRFLFPSLALDALKSSGDARLVASPNVRVISGEAGEVNIGEKISTTQSTIYNPGTSGSSSSLTAQTQYSYEDVGVKVKVEPRVHFNDDITLKIESSVTTLKSGSTPGRPDLGRREIKTYARLRDGEMAVFGGLLKDEEQKSLQGIWGLSSIPVIGKLFSNNLNKRAKTDVILTIRAVLVRRPDLTADDFEAFDPDLAASKAGPFVPKPTEGREPVSLPATGVKVLPSSTPAQPPVPETAPVAAEPAKPKASAQAPAEEPQAQDLVLFVSPLTTNANKGDRLQLALMVSGGKGVASGSVALRIDPRLKLLSVGAGDFLTNEKGVLEQQSLTEGSLRVGFRRPTAPSDSGTLLFLELEAVAPGNAPILIESGTYLVGGNPVPARIVNGLVVVD